MKFTSDIDIDFGDREQLLKHINVTLASIRKENNIKKHNTGIHPTNIPYDPIHNVSALDYVEAEKRGYIKLDFLNVWVYKLVRDEKHLEKLLLLPNWELLRDKQFFEKLIHIGNHWDTMLRMPEPIDSIPRLAMFLALIRPGKKHLIGSNWSDVAKTIWDRNVDGYTFRKSHAIAYAHLVVVHMNLLVENPIASVLQE